MSGEIRENLLAVPEKLTCDICMEEHNKLLRLDCGHPLCAICLQQIKTHTEEKEKGKNNTLHKTKIPCPFCKTVTKIKRSKAISSLPAVYSGKLKCYTCLELKGTKDTLWCLECREFICTTCEYKEHRNRNHPTKPFEESSAPAAVLNYIKHREESQVTTEEMARNSISKFVDPAVKALEAAYEIKKKEKTTQLVRRFNKAFGIIKKPEPKPSVDKNGEKLLKQLMQLSGGIVGSENEQKLATIIISETLITEFFFSMTLPGRDPQTIDQDARKEILQAFGAHDKSQVDYLKQKIQLLESIVDSRDNKLQESNYHIEEYKGALEERNKKIGELESMITHQELELEDERVKNETWRVPRRNTTVWDRDTARSIPWSQPTLKLTDISATREGGSWKEIQWERIAIISRIYDDGFDCFLANEPDVQCAAILTNLKCDSIYADPKSMDTIREGDIRSLLFKGVAIAILKSDYSNGFLQITEMRAFAYPDQSNGPKGRPLTLVKGEMARKDGDLYWRYGDGEFESFPPGKPFIPEGRGKRCIMKLMPAAVVPVWGRVRSNMAGRPVAVIVCDEPETVDIGSWNKMVPYYLKNQSRRPRSPYPWNSTKMDHQDDDKISRKRRDGPTGTVGLHHTGYLEPYQKHELRRPAEDSIMDAVCRNEV